MGSGIGTRYDGPGITSNSIATTKTRARKRKHKCMTPRRRRNRRPVAQTPTPVPPPAPTPTPGLGGFRIQGSQAQLTDWNGGNGSRFNVANGQTVNVVNDQDAGGFNLDVTGRQVTSNPNDIGINSMKINAGGSMIEICPCGDVKFKDANGKDVKLDLKDGLGTDKPFILPNGVKVSTALVNGKEQAVVENGEYLFTADYNKTAENCAQYDLKMREKAAGVADNATPSPAFLKMDQIFG